MCCDTYQWLWVYVAVEPATGRTVCLLLPHVDGAYFERFLQTTAQYFADQRMTVVLDNAPSHHNQQITWPANLTPLYLPPYSPELNPAEQVFRHLRKVLANRVFDTLDDLEIALCDALRLLFDQPEIVVSLTNYPWWDDATRTLSA